LELLVQINELQNLGLCSSGMLHGIGWQLVNDVSEQSFSFFFSLQAVQMAAGTLKMGLTDCYEIL
jgi:hypothetical protein